MTTISIKGVGIAYSGETGSPIGEVVATIVAPSARTTFRYALLDLYNGETDVEIRSPVMQRSINDINRSNLVAEWGEAHFSVLTVEWAGKSTTIVTVGNDTDNDPGHDIDINLHFVLAGDPLPRFETADDWAAFSASITDISLPTGALRPGRPIRWSDFQTVEITEDDILYGTPDDDRFRGGIGDDRFFSTDGRDRLHGDAGVDLVSFENDPSGVRVNLTKGKAVDGWGNKDKLKTIENVVGSGHADRIIGSNGENRIDGLDANDMLKGLGGNDVLIGGAGRDVLNGGKGDDHLTGGPGPDRFLFRGKFGDDTITDFDVDGTTDRIVLKGVKTITSFDDLMNDHVKTHGGFALIDDGRGNSILLEGVKVGDLSADDFLF
ncbi:calcium-binding protein [Chachezhania sediminis]|uniref:calcium-binding protein n=1 Tax=Chachezhania sediminis TaxID=2599291 RepID=UPI00131C2E85|nr:calcium-binding protein [Chachezhania sediminis]